MQSAEKSDYASYAQALFSVSLKTLPCSSARGEIQNRLLYFSFIITDADKICVKFSLTQILYRMMYTGVIKALEGNKWYSKKQQCKC